MPRNNRRESERVRPKPVENYIPRVIVKFRDNDNGDMPPAERARIQQDEIKRYESIERNPERYLGDSWIRLVEQHRGLTIQKLITSVTPQQIIKLNNKSWRPIRTNRPANFLTYFAVSCPSAEIAQEVAKTLRNHKLWPTVAGAYVEGGPALPPAVTLSPNESASQHHLDPSLANGGDPGGIDARYAWTISGGDGDVGSTQVGLQFVDMEWGWVLDHEDLPTIPAPISVDPVMIPGDNDSGYQGHGTAVLGIVVAVNNNSKPCVGIAPQVKTTKVVSPWVWNGTTWTYSVANAVFAALSLPLYPGDVLLLEVQTRKNSPIGFGYPVEFEQADFEAIKTATDAGIIVIEAAGNAGDNLDNLVANNWTSSSNGVVNAIQFSLNPSDNRFQDSGAIMVGSALAATVTQAASVTPALKPRSRNNNYGKRIDCYAWDNSIWTTGYDDQNPPATSPTTSYFGFSGTSGASAIIAGAALAIQGVAQVNQKGDLANGRCSPNQLRSILGDPNTGTASHDPPNDKIGVMPDLKKIINETLKITLLEPIARKRKDLINKPPKRHGGPGPKKQALRKKPAEAKRKSPK